jgi:cellulose synthase/poly-beta-1,6-N-acetylglucosamine synthase-like glycosyltransferase
MTAPAHPAAVNAPFPTGEERAGVSVIMPAFNEERQIFEMIAETHLVMEDIGRPYEIIVVNDGSTDGTGGRIEAAAREFDHVRPLILPENQGKGNALNRGFQVSSMDLVCFIDADLDLHPGQLRKLLAEMDRTGADVVIGSKRHPESNLDYPWYRKIFSAVYYSLIWLLFRLPVKDTQTGIKLFRREVLARSFPRIVGKKYTLDLELLLVANRLGYRIAEAPITLTFQRTLGRATWPSIRNIITDTMAVFYRLNLLRYYHSEMLPTNVDEPRVSIVMIAPELDSLFERFYERCLDLNYSNFDIKVVTDSPLTEELMGSRLAFISGKGGSNASMKNQAVAESDEAEIIAFIENDAIPDIDWLKNAVPYFEDAAVAGVCGPAIAPDEGTRRQVAGGMVFSSFMVSGTTNYRYTRHAMRDVDDYPSFNFLVRRSDFLDAGGVPEALAGGEDTVLCLRLTRDLGKRLIYVPNVLLFQHRARLYLPHLGNVYSYAKTRGRFVREFPETSRRLPYFIPSALLVFLLGGLPLSLISRWVLYVYLVAVSLYVGSAAFASVKTLDVLTNLLIFPGIIATNMVYGFGFLRGLLTPGSGSS